MRLFFQSVSSSHPAARPSSPPPPVPSSSTGPSLASHTNEDGTLTEEGLRAALRAQQVRCPVAFVS
jgi:hypothetical protein